ncbi:hybrid sensor histidine kinase/response regulator [Odoribacter lunatus]|uniref:ATP-binding response regulator n=1 Tax=Odoribacter lunatus TaxID=2941335 RepID=UPI00203D099A|nr:hybrid sensor histidine kinase/response regulator [Odoribacter lunatus]
MLHKKRAYILWLLSSSEDEVTKLEDLLQDTDFRLVKRVYPEPLFFNVENKPDLIILNPTIPEKHYSIQYIRNQTFTRNIPVIFIGFFSPNVIGKEFHFPLSDFITFPLQKNELLFRIYHLLFQYKTQRFIQKQNERLKQSILSRDKFYTVIAHDLRAPISTIKMINAIIESEKSKIKNVSIRRKFEMINETTEEVFNLLENLLKWTRKQTGQIKFTPTQFEIGIIVQQVITLFTSIADSKNIHLSLHMHSPIQVYADEDMVKTIMRNFISNAIKFTFPYGKVDVYLKKDKKSAFISVKDNGVGISPENQKRIIQGDDRLTTYGTNNEKGSGLGLLLCRDFIRTNKGKFYLSSTPGEGSVFSFTLPTNHN